MNKESKRANEFPQIGAFVTFEEPMGIQNCLRAYKQPKCRGLREAVVGPPLKL